MAIDGTSDVAVEQPMCILPADASVIRQWFVAALYSSSKAG
jgi:hypothetical protein